MTATRKTTKTPRKPRNTVAGPKQASDAKTSKLDRIVSHVTRPEGASLDELVTATGWRPHSVRGALAGSIKRKGYAIVSERIDGERRYRIGEAQ